MTTSNAFWTNDATPKKLTKKYEDNEITMINAKLDALMKKLKTLDMKVVDIPI